MIQLNTTVGAAPGPSPDQTALQGPPEDQALRTLINAKDQLQDPRPVAPDAEPGARFLAPGFAPQGIGELAEYRKANAERRRLGLSPLPELDLDKMPPDQPLPEGLRKFLQHIDALLPEILRKHGASLEQLFDGEFRRGETTPVHLTVLGANAAMFGYLAFDILSKIEGTPDLAVLTAAVYAGAKSADVFTYLGHHFFDNYDLHPAMRHEALEFQAHHYDPKEVTKWEDVMTVGNSGMTMAVPVAIIAALAAAGVPSMGVEAALTTFCAGSILAPLIHKWSHLPHPPKLAELAQKLGVIVSPETHRGHHFGKRDQLLEGEQPSRHVDSFALVTGKLGGDVNALLDAMSVPRHVERAMWMISEKIRGPGQGIEPVAWQEHPELRAWKLPKGERKQALLSARIAAYETELERQRVKVRDVKAKIPANSPPERVAMLQVAEAKLSRMTRALEVLRDPSQLEALEKEYQKAQAQLIAAEGQLGRTFMPNTPFTSGDTKFDGPTFLKRTRAKEQAAARVEELSDLLQALRPALA
jgi:hypothetical protein